MSRETAQALSIWVQRNTDRNSLFITANCPKRCFWPNGLRCYRNGALSYKTCHCYDLKILVFNLDLWKFDSLYQFDQCCHYKDSLDSYSYLSRLMTKPTKWHVRPAKTQISLGIRPVWSESSLSAWRKIGSLATHWAHSEDWSDWADAQADLSLRWAQRSFCWFCHEAAHLLQCICITIMKNITHTNKTKHVAHMFDLHKFMML